MTGLSRRLFLGTAAAASALGAAGLPAFAQTKPVKIGVLADFSGIYTDLLGPGGVGCVRQAIADLAPDFPVEVVYGDHQNKADIGPGIARRWFDTDGVDMLIAGPNSAVGLAASVIAHEKNKPCLGVAVTATEFTGQQCNPNTVNWTYDGYMLSKAAGPKRSGQAARSGISSPPTTRSGIPFRPRQPPLSKRQGARSWAIPPILSA